MPSYIHEADVFGTLMAIAQNIKDSKIRKVLSPVKDGNKLQSSSIARATKDLTMSFPVLCSDTVSYDTARIITKAVEHNSITMLRQLFSAIHLQGRSGFEVIANFHTNIDRKLGIDDYFDMVDKFVDKYGLESAVFKDKAEAEYLEECKRDFLNSLSDVYPVNSFSESSVNDFYINDRHGLLITERVARGVDPRDVFDAEERERERQEKQFGDANQRTYQRSADYANMKMKEKEHELNLDKDQRAKGREMIDLFKSQLLPTDVKKANELVPSLFIVNYQYTIDKDATNVQNVISEQFIAGVKARLIACPSFEIIEHVMKFKKNGVNMLNLIKATTKEQKFSKDFIMGIKQAKIDAKKDSKLYKTSSIWRSLQKRGAQSNTKFYRLAKTSNSAAAITTLVMTQQEADFLNNNYNINIATVAVAREFMEAYNLIALCIVDEQVRVAKFLYDGNSYFDEYTFGSLEKESNNDIHKILPLLGR